MRRTRRMTVGVQTLLGLIGKVGWSHAELARRAELDAGAVSRFLTGRRQITRLAAIQIERAILDAIARKEIRVEALTRGELLDASIANDSTPKAS